jgi:hypothetical protein
MANIPVFEVQFNKDGNIVDQQEVTKALDGLAAMAATDLLVLSHGWNDDIADARKLYGGLLPRIEAQLPAAGAGRTFAALEIFWPSKKYADPALTPGGAAALGDGSGDLDAATRVARLEELKAEPEQLGVETVDPERAAKLAEAQGLVPTLETNQESQRRFVEILRSLLSQNDANPDDSTDALFTTDPVELLQTLSDPVPVPLPPAPVGGATMVGDDTGSVPEGGAAGIKDFFSGIKAAAGRFLNLFTYAEMKKRAGLVGRTGVVSVLRQVHERLPALKIHLVGHSFGGRLLTSTADNLGPDVKPSSLILLQAAYSHNGLASQYDGKNDGFFRQVVAGNKVAGPILITYTKNDLGNGIAYPIGARLSGDVASALGDKNDPYGGMGRNGAQHTPEVDTASAFVERVGTPYQFTAGRVYNLNADEFVKGHSDIAKDEVAFALLSGIAIT